MGYEFCRIRTFFNRLGKSAGIQQRLSVQSDLVNGILLQTANRLLGTTKFRIKLVPSFSREESIFACQTNTRELCFVSCAVLKTFPCKQDAIVYLYRCLWASVDFICV